MIEINGKEYDWTPLLAHKPLNQFTPEDYKAYVRGMFSKKEKKIREIKIKPPYVWKISPKKKSFSIKMNRLWITKEEITKISRESGIEERIVWAKITEKKATIVDSEEQWRKMQTEI